MTRVFTHCHPHNPSIICQGRHEARVRGAFFWDMAIGGYVCSDLPTRRSSFRAKYYEMDVSDGLPYRLEICPFCGMQLPALFGEESEMRVTDGEDGD